MTDSYFKKSPDELRRIMDTSPPDTPAYIKARDALLSRGEPLRPYTYQPYPRMLYHWKLGQTTVQSQQEEQQHLQRGWVNTPREVWKPRRMYHPTLKSDGHIFDSPEEEAEAVAKGWVDSPAKFPAVKLTQASSGKTAMNSSLTAEQMELLNLLARLYREGRKSEFIIVRTIDGSGLVFLGGGENVSIDSDDSDFLALQDEGLIRLYRDERRRFSWKNHRCRIGFNGAKARRMEGITAYE